MKNLKISHAHSLQQLTQVKNDDLKKLKLDILDMSNPQETTQTLDQNDMI